MAAIASEREGMTAPRGLVGLAGLALRSMVESLQGRLARVMPRPVTFRVRGLAMPLPKIAPARGGIAQEMYRGHFSFHGKTFACNGRVVFDLDVADDAWLAALHGFDWLHGLTAKGRFLWRVFARSLISDWEERNGRLPAAAMRPEVMARRIMNWICAAPGLLEGAPEDFGRLFFNSLTWQIKKLSRRGLRGSTAYERMMVRLALAHAAVGLQGLEQIRTGVLRRLAEELRRQILPDGGHVSRSPAILLDIVTHLAPLREALEKAKLPIPEDLGNALERAMPMLRFFSHGDGGLVLFNGVSDPACGPLAAVLAADRIGGRPLSHAPHSGYGRLSQGVGLVVADVGRPPAPGLNPDAALSVAAFEFSHGPMRIITNCGAPRIPSRAWRRAARLSSAHSTVTMGGQEAGRILDNALTQALFRGAALTGPGRLQAQVRETSGGSLLEVSHDAFARGCGFVHTRRLFLAPDGQDLRGEDVFAPAMENRPPREVPFVIRFHLHPSVDASLSRDGNSIVLRLADKSGWTFSARGGRVRLEESVLLAAEKGLRRTVQIVVEGAAGQSGNTVKWFLRRMEEAPRRKKRAGKEACPQLPL